MGGASPRFSGKGDFLRTHGYDEVIGREWFENSNQLKSKMEGWGLLDWELMNEAAEKAISMHQQKERFVFTLLTLDTHQPGFPQDSSCAPFPSEAGSDPLRKSAFCTDKSLQLFLNRLEAAGVLQDTAVWLQSDHPQFQTDQKKNALGLAGLANLKLVSVLKVPHSTSPQLIENPASAFDFPASALDILGIEYRGRFQRGVSVFGSEFKARTHIASSFRFENSAPTSESPDTGSGECPRVSLSKPLVDLPLPWSRCAYAAVEELSSLDQQQLQARAQSLAKSLKDLRFTLAPQTKEPLVYKVTDPQHHNLLLSLSGSEATEAAAAVQPYILEYSNAGELVNVRKTDLNQELQRQSKEAVVGLAFANETVVMKSCSGSIKILGTAKVFEGMESKLDFRR